MAPRPTTPAPAVPVATTVGVRCRGRVALGVYAIGVRRLARRGRCLVTGVGSRSKSRCRARGSGAAAGIDVLLAHDPARAARHGRTDPARIGSADHVVLQSLRGLDPEGDLAAGVARSCWRRADPPARRLGAVRGHLDRVLHPSPLFELSLEHSWLHVLGACPLPARRFAVLVAVGGDRRHAETGAGTARGCWQSSLQFRSTPSSVSHRSRTRRRSRRCLDPSIGDQHAAAGILWASGELLTLVMAGIVFAQWWAASSESR